MCPTIEILTEIAIQILLFLKRPGLGIAVSIIMQLGHFHAFCSHVSIKANLYATGYYPITYEFVLLGECLIVYTWLWAPFCPRLRTLIIYCTIIFFLYSDAHQFYCFLFMYHGGKLFCRWSLLYRAFKGSDAY